MNMLNKMYHRNFNERALGEERKKVIFILFYLHTRTQVSSTSLAGCRKSLWPETLHRPAERWNSCAQKKKKMFPGTTGKTF